MAVITSLNSSDELESYSRTTINTNFSNLDAKLPFKVVGTTADQADYVCDGTADDVQIQEAIDAVNTAGGGTVFIKAGTYNFANNNAKPAYMAAAISYIGLVLKDKVKLTGEGIGKTILNLASFDTGTGCRYSTIVPSAAGIGEMEISDMTIQLPDYLAGAGAYWGTCIYFEGTDNVLLKNLYLINGTWTFVGTTKSFNDTTKELTTDTHNLVIDNVVTDSYVGSAGLVYVKDVTVNNCKFYECHDDSLLISIAAQNISITNNIFDGENPTSGGASGHIYLVNDTALTSDIYGVSNINIEGNTFLNAKTSAFWTGGDGVKFIRVKNVRISNNFIKNCDYGISNGGGGSMAEDVLISNNIISHCADSGIVLGSGSSGSYLTGFHIVNNKIYNNTDYGIEIYSVIANSLNNFVITGNEIYDDQAVETQATGLYLLFAGTSSLHKNFIVTNNNIHDTTTPLWINLGATGDFLGMIKNNNGTDIVQNIDMKIMTNGSGGNLVRGDVVTLKAVAAGNQFTTTTTQGDDLVFGVLAEDIANGASGYIQILGKTRYLKVDGTTDIAIGDYLGTFTTAGIAMKASAGDMAFAVALEAYATNDSAGVIDALLIKPKKVGSLQSKLTNSAGLLAALSDETGAGLAVFNTTPTLVTPILGTATGTALDLTVPASGNDIPLVITQNDTTNNPNAVTITNPGGGHGLYIYQNGTGRGLYIDSRSTTEFGIYLAASKYGLGVINVGTGWGIQVNQDANGLAIDIDKDCTVNNTRTWAMAIASDNAGTGTALGCGIDLSSFAVDEPVMKAVADAINTAGTLTGQIAVDIAGTTYYIPYYTHGSVV